MAYVEEQSVKVEIINETLDNCTATNYGNRIASPLKLMTFKNKHELPIKNFRSGKDLSFIEIVFSDGFGNLVKGESFP